MAAVLACGDGAVLSGHAAAFWFGLRRGRPPEPEVTAPRRCRVPGVEVRQVRALDEREVGMHRGIPITTVPRTLVDLAATLGEEHLARTCHEATVRFGTAPESVEGVLDRRPNAPGARTLRRILRGDVHVVLSKLERRFLELLGEHSLPRPVTNRRAGSYWVDCRWPEHKLTVELQSYTFHNSRHSFEHDHRREREAYLRGDEFRRYTWGDVFEHPRLMLRELRGLVG